MIYRNLSLVAPNIVKEIFDDQLGLIPNEYIVSLRALVNILRTLIAELELTSEKAGAEILR